MKLGQFSLPINHMDGTYKRGAICFVDVLVRRINRTTVVLAAVFIPSL